MSRHQGIGQKAVPQGVEMEERLLNDVVGAWDELVTFTTYQDFTDASTRYKDAIDQFGLHSSQAREKKTHLDDVKSRLHPIDS